MTAARRLARRGRTGLVGLLVALVPAMISVRPSGAEPVPGSAGVDTSLPATDSQVTVRGRGPFQDLEVTVNQTGNLVNQAISITWQGGTPTRSAPSRFGGHYLQMMQCWGDDDGTVPGNPGPPPEQCVQGAVAGTFGGIPGSLFPSGMAMSRIISRSTWANFDPDVGHLDPRTTNVWRPFRAVDGTVVDVHTDPEFNPSVIGGNFWLNPYFSIVTTNEIAGSPTGPNGRGRDLFQVLTGVESSGLGCGQRVQPVEDGGRKIPDCWLVIVPRGAPADENVETPFEENADQHGVFTSPLSPAAWQHRIAIPLGFRPVDTPCSIEDDDRRIVGTELVLPAVSSWQPVLCTTPGLPPYSYANVGDSSARLQLANPAPGGPGMIVVSRPLAGHAVDPANPVVYAPVSLSGAVIGFNVERNPHPDASSAAHELAGVRVAELNLTPRLAAKLSTQSYRQQVEIKETPPYDWLEGNPRHLGEDPDFLQFNPEFEILQIASGRNFGGLVMPAANSDAARQVWEWIFADPEAKAWLDGEPDPWGMAVNPVYATTAAANANGVPFGEPVPESFPKSDPFCHYAPPRGQNGSIVPPALCGTDWLPYSRSLNEAARITRAADDGARIVENPFALTADKVWERDTPQFLGRRAILSLTDTASANQFGLQVARLSRAGDNGPDRAFMAPDRAGLTAGAEAMAPHDEPSVLEPDPTAASTSAYPLTALTYAAIAPLALDEQARAEYAAFVEYAAGPGQEPGLELGQLPPGYAPLPASLRARAAEAAETIRTLEAPVEPEEPVPPTTVTPATVTPATAPVTAPVPAPASRALTARTRAPSPAVEVASSATTAGGTRPSGVSLGKGQLTPIIAVGGNRFTILVLGVVALASALAALEITKRPRRQPLDRAAPDGGRVVTTGSAP